MRLDFRRGILREIPMKDKRGGMWTEIWERRQKEGGLGRKNLRPHVVLRKPHSGWCLGNFQAKEPYWRSPAALVIFMLLQGKTRSN